MTPVLPMSKNHRQDLEESENVTAQMAEDDDDDAPAPAPAEEGPVTTTGGSRGVV